jgi:hypothetical protein
MDHPKGLDDMTLPESLGDADELVREDVRESLNAWATRGQETGGFLRCVLENDLFGAMARADSYNTMTLHEICEYIYWQLPAACWGSKEKVAAWQEIQSAAYEKLQQQVEQQRKVK